MAYYITKRKSATGLKFQEVQKKMDVAFDAQVKLSEEYGFKSWRGASWPICGGFSAVELGLAADTKVWRNVNGEPTEWMPRRTSKAGKEIDAKFKAMPTVSRQELNDCIGWKAPIGWHIGFAARNKIFFGFTTEDKWTLTIPDDCEEVTRTKYRKLFKMEGDKNEG